MHHIEILSMAPNDLKKHNSNIFTLCRITIKPTMLSKFPNRPCQIINDRAKQVNSMHRPQLFGSAELLGA